MEVLAPSQLTQFDSSLTLYGPLLGIPVWGDTVQIGGLFGSTTGVTAYTAELSYRLNLSTPLIRTFLFLGGHYLQYSASSAQGTHDEGLVGVNGGAGFQIDLNKNAQGLAQIKLYRQDRPLFSLAAGFAFLL